MKKYNLIITLVFGILLIGIINAVSVEQSFKGTVLPILPNLSIYSPIDNSIYDSGRIVFNLTALEGVDSISYIDWNDRIPREIKLCRNCDEYGNLKRKIKTFRDGEHNLSFMSNKGDKTKNINISFFIDSRKPRISKTEPRRNSFTNGSGFYIRVNEENIKNIIINFSSLKELDLESCIESRGYTECYIDLNLTDYEGQTIDYFFNVEDIAGNTDESRPTSVKVDTILPNLTNPDSFWARGEGRYLDYIYFNLNIEELNFDKVVLTYDYRGRTIERRLCSNLRYGKCTYKFRLNNAYNNFQLKIQDKAGNSIQRELNFNPQ